jgi:hypothetical protein
MSYQKNQNKSKHDGQIVGGATLCAVGPNPFRFNVPRLPPIFDENTELITDGVALFKTLPISFGTVSPVIDYINGPFEGLRIERPGIASIGITLVIDSSHAHLLKAQLVFVSDDKRIAPSVVTGIARVSTEDNISIFVAATTQQRVTIPGTFEVHIGHTAIKCNRSVKATVIGNTVFTVQEINA